MRKLWKLATVAGVTAVGSLLAVGPAGAITSQPAGYGFDGHPNVIVGGGSDTTAVAMLNIGDLWSKSAINNGCQHTVPATPGQQNQCDNTVDKPFLQSNWDGDTIAEANPTGSGAGRAALENRSNATQSYEGTVNTFSNPAVRTDNNVTLTNGSAVVGDTAATANDVGLMVTSATTGFPTPVYVGAVNPGVSLSLSASKTAQKDDPFTGTTTSTASITLSKYGCLNATTSAGSVPDFGRSSSTPSGSGVADCGAELNGTTFWGYAHDSVEVGGFGANALALNGATGGVVDANLIAAIWECTGTPTGVGAISGLGATSHKWTWNDVATYTGIGAPLAGNTNQIVPWGMNTGSGTYGTFNSYVVNNTSPKQANFTADGGAPGGTGGCAASLNGGTAGTDYPLENDVKPLFANTNSGLTGSGLQGFGAGGNNPNNWLMFGSFGVFSAFPYTSSITSSITGSSVFYQLTAAALNGLGVNSGTSFLPSTSLTSNYPIQRILWHVTRKGDADCPGVMSAGVRVCDFTGQPGPTIGAGPTTDLNVVGGTSGTSGAVREFTRFICRNLNQQLTDPFSGVNEFNAVTAAINGAGFTVVPSAQRTAGTRCDVLT